MTSFNETINSAPWSPVKQYLVPAALDGPCAGTAGDILAVFKRNSWLKLCTAEAEVWFLYFYQVLENSFADIKEVGVATRRCTKYTSLTYNKNNGPQASGIVWLWPRACLRCLYNGVVLPAVSSLSGACTRPPGCFLLQRGPMFLSHV